MPNYTQLRLGFVALGTVFVLTVVRGQNRGIFLLSAGSFYAAVGFYLFSQGNTLYGFAESRNDPNLYDAGHAVTNAAYFVAAGAAIHLGIGLGIVSYSVSDLRIVAGWMSVSLGEGSVRLLQYYTPAFGVVVAQFPVLEGLRRHRANHLWFQYLRDTDDGEAVTDRPAIGLDGAEPGGDDDPIGRTEVDVGAETLRMRMVIDDFEEFLRQLADAPRDDVASITADAGRSVTLLYRAAADEWDPEADIGQANRRVSFLAPPGYTVEIDTGDGEVQRTAGGAVEQLCGGGEDEEEDGE